MATGTRTFTAALGASSAAARLLPALDVGLAALAAAIWYVRPQEGGWPLALVGLAWLLRLLVYGYPSRPTPFDVPLLVFLTTALVGAGLAYNQGMQWMDTLTPILWTWAKYWNLIAAVALGYAVANLRGVRQTWAFARVYVLLAPALTLYFLITNDWLAGPGKFDLLTRLGALLSEPLPEVPGRHLHPNVVGAIIAMVLPFCFALLGESWKRRREAAAWGVLTLAALFGLLLSASRGAWLAAGLVLLVWVLWRAWSGGQSRARLGLIVLACALLGGTLLAAGLADLGALRVAVDGGSSVVVSRVAMWQGGWSLARDYFFTGAGPGSGAMLLSAYALQLPVLFVAHTHNLLLDVLIEQGIVGLAALVWLLALVVLLVLRGLRALAGQRTRQAVLARWLLEAALASTAVTLLHSQIDDPAYGSRALLLLFVPLGVVAALCPRVPEMRVRMPWRALALALALVLAVGLWQRGPILAQWHADLGALAQARTELSTFHAPDRLPETVRREADLSDAQTEFARALEADPANRTAAQRLALIALARAQYDEALTRLEPLYRRDPADPTTRQLLGDAYLALGRQDEAFALWSSVDNAENKLRLEAGVRYRDDPQRAAWTRQLADRIVAAR